MKTVKWFWWMALLLVLWKLFFFGVYVWNGGVGIPPGEMDSFMGVAMIFVLLSAFRFLVWFLIWFFEGPKPKKTLGPTMSK